MGEDILILVCTGNSHTERLLNAIKAQYRCKVLYIQDITNPINSIQKIKPKAVVFITDEKNLYIAVGISNLCSQRKILIVQAAKLIPIDLHAFSDTFDHVLIDPKDDQYVLKLIQKTIKSILSDEKDDVKRKLLKSISLSGIIGKDREFLKTISRIPLIAERDIPVMLYGETGVGKEVVARTIHYLSPRSNKPFIPVDCGTIPINLFENELFGHKKGAFTDAKVSYNGLIEEANGGTLFLDEIDAINFKSQSKLLRLIQENVYRPLGSSKDRKANIRIIAATNIDIKIKVEKNAFRSDLYYRFGIILNIIPLRERKDDIPLLAEHFITKHATSEDERSKKISPAAMRKLMSYEWPGNIRELENIIRQSLILSSHSVLKPEDINLHFSRAPNSIYYMPFKEAKKLTIEKFEKDYIEHILLVANGNITKASEIANKDRSDFSRLVKKYNL